MLKLYPKVVFTVDSAVRLEGFIAKRDLAKAESALAADPEEPWRDFAERINRATILDEVAESPFIRGKLDELGKVLRDNPYSDSAETGDTSFAYRMLSNRREAVQIIREIIEFLERDQKKSFRTDRMIEDKKQPNIALYADGNAAVQRLFIKIAEVIGCKEKLERFLRKYKSPVYLLILESENSKTASDDKINSAFICL